MQQPKWALTSKTIIGALFMILAYVLGPNGFDLSFVQDFANGALDEGVFTIGSVLALIGRYVGTKPIYLWKK